MAKNRKPAPRGNQMQATMARALALRDEMEAAQAEIAATVRTGEAGEGKVKVTINGGGDLLGVEIEPSLLKPENAQFLSDMIVEAAEEAKTAMEEVTQERMGKYAQMMQLG